MRERGGRARAALAIALLLGSVGAAHAQPVFGPGQDPIAGSQVLARKGCVKCHAGLVSCWSPCWTAGRRGRSRAGY
jgi:hypothetical protein